MTSHDGDVGGDLDRGLTIDWLTKPSNIPGQVDSNIALDAVTFRLTTIKVIGDAGFPSKDKVELDWKQGEQPDPIVFSDAPVGIYSQVYLAATGTIEYAFEISGTAKVNGDSKPFVIHDITPLGAMMQTSVMVAPNSEATLNITIDIAQAVQSVNFSQLNDIGGTLTLDTFDDAMSDFRDKLMNDCFGANEGPHSNAGSNGPH